MVAMSSPPNNAPELMPDVTYKHDRWYGTWKPGKYLFPVDAEESNRMDIFHKFFMVILNEKAFEFPLRTDQKPKILDLGTGTAIWAIHVAEEFAPGAEIMAIDLNNVQPASLPPGVSIKQFDIEDPSWDSLLRDCNLIHMRMLFGSVHADLWPQVYRKAYEHLAPGHGYVEQIEIDWTPHWDGDDIPSPSALKEWSDLFLTSMDRYNRRIRIVPNETKRSMESSGLTDFKEEILKCYVNPWSRDPQEREIARWFNLGFCHGVEAMSLLPFTEQLGMPLEAVRALCEKVKKEVCILRYRAYFSVHVWTAKRPANKPQ